MNKAINNIISQEYEDFNDLLNEIYYFEQENGLVCLYHCTSNPCLIEILPSLEGPTGYDFGGLFFSYHPVRDYGQHTYLTFFKKGEFSVARNSDIQDSEEWEALEDGEFKEAVGNDNFGLEDGHSQWIAQCLRNKIARSLGFDCVDNGDGVVVFAGAELFKLN